MEASIYGAKRLKVAIVGAGIAGLAAAFDLQKAGGFEIVLFEKAAEAGGKIQTTCEGDLLIELGPDSIFSTKPWAIDLMRELGMGADLIEPLSSEFSMLIDGKLHTVPRALASLLPSTPGALEKAGFLSDAAKRRALKEAEIEAGDEEDESIASFFSRRFGDEFSSLVAEPLLAGTHAGDPTKLSMAALYPTYLSMERSRGSISQAAADGTRSNPNKAGFLTLRKGMATFPSQLADALTDVQLMLSTEVRDLRSEAGSLMLETSWGPVAVDHVILATPAFAASRLVRGIAPAAADSLEGIRFVSTAVATFAYKRSAFPHQLTGNGFLVPYGESTPLTGCTWSSNKWPERAPDDLLLLRAFMGREAGLDVDRHGDEELISLATGALAETLNATQPPIFSRLDRWPKGMPQYELGHLDRVAAIEEALGGLPITLTGASYRGNSISDSVRQGREAASKLSQKLVTGLSSV